MRLTSMARFHRSPTSRPLPTLRPSPVPRRTGRRAAGVSLALLLTAGACTDGGSSAEPADRSDGTNPGTSNGVLGFASLSSFSSCDDALDAIQERAREEVGPYGFGESVFFGSRGEVLVPVGAAIEGDDAGVPDRPTSDPVAPPGVPAGEPGIDFSGTNNQETGVDEPDTVKTDGEHLYVVTDTHLEILRLVEGSAPEKVGSMRLPDGSGHELLLSGDRAFLLYEEQGVEIQRDRDRPFDTESVDGENGDVAPGGWVAWTPVTAVAEIDLSDRSEPREVKTLVAEGRRLSARLTGGSAHVVVASQPPQLPFVFASGPGAEDRATEANRSLIDDTTLEDWLPAVALEGQGRLDTDCDRVHLPKSFAGFSPISVISIGADDGLDAEPELTTVMANGETVYASANNLYVTSSAWNNDGDDGLPRPVPLDMVGESIPGNNGVDDSVVDSSEIPQPTPTIAESTERSLPPGSSPEDVGSEDPGSEDPGEGAPPPDADQTAEDRIEPAPPDREPIEPIPAPVDPEDPPVIDESGYTTNIHQFSLADGAATYRASGAVNGHLLNQFSLSEHDGFLRVATTEGEPWGGGSESFVTVLRADDNGDGAEGLEVVGQVGDMGKGERIYSVRFIGDRGYVVTFRETDPLYSLDLSDPAEPTVTGELKILGYSSFLQPVSEHFLVGVGQDADQTGRTQGAQISLFDVSDPADPQRVDQITLPGGRSAAEYDHRAFTHWAPTSDVFVPYQSGTGDSGTLVLRHNATNDADDQVGSLTERGDLAGIGTRWSGGNRRTVIAGDQVLTIGTNRIDTYGLAQLDRIGKVVF